MKYTGEIKEEGVEGWLLEARWDQGRESARDAPSAQRWEYAQPKRCTALWQRSRALHSAHCSCQSCTENVTPTLHICVAFPCCPCCQWPIIGTAPVHQTKGFCSSETIFRGKRRKEVSSIIFNVWPTSWAVLLCTKDPCVERTLAHR